MTKKTTLPHDFDANAYLELNPDVREAGVDVIEHYLRCGLLEGRSYKRERRESGMTLGEYLYYGNLGVDEKQYGIEQFLGLALYPQHDREIKHNALDRLPFDNESILKIQSQDVFEHLPYESITKIFDDIYRVLKITGVFRLSVPDYRSPFLKKRSVYDYKGSVIGDLRMGAEVSYDRGTASVRANFTTNGTAHIWFPRYELILDLVIRSKLRLCSDIRFYQYFTDEDSYVCDPIPENEMYVMRSVPNDKRANGMPISIVVDFIK